MADGNVRNVRSAPGNNNSKPPSNCDIDRWACWAFECFIEEIEQVASTRVELEELRARYGYAEGDGHG